MALKAFPYAGASIAVGEVFEARSFFDAQVLLTANMAAVERQTVTLEAPEWDGVIPPKRRRARKTEDDA